MTKLSVLEEPPFLVTYPSLYELATLNTVAATSVASYRDDFNVAYDLNIGASSNVRIEAENNVQMFMGNLGNFEMYNTTYANDVRTDSKIFDINGESTKTIISSYSNQFEIKSFDPYSTIFLNNFHIFSSNYFTNLDTTASNGFAFKSSVAFNKDVFFQGDLVVGSNIYAKGSLDHINLKIKVFYYFFCIFSTMKSNELCFSVPIL